MASAPEHDLPARVAAVVRILGHLAGSHRAARRYASRRARETAPGDVDQLRRLGSSYPFALRNKI